MGDASDEPWGILALIVAFVLLVFKGDSRRLLSPYQCASITGLALIYALNFGTVPPLVRGVIAAAAVTVAGSALLNRSRIHLGLFGLMILSLPLIASLQFYLGFPLRFVTAQIAAALISLGGFVVQAEGTNLLWRGEIVSVDLPCSGVRMLWTGLFLCFTLCSFNGLSNVLTWVGYICTMCLVFLGNLLRTTMLFFTESKIVDAPDWAHAAIGLFCFALVAAAIVVIIGRFRADATEPLIEHTYRPSFVWNALPAVILLLALVPGIAKNPERAIAVNAFPGFPSEYDGRKIEALPLSADEAEYHRTFPGRVGRFTDGSKQIILRWITRESRTLHPAADCLSASGYSVRPGPVRVDRESKHWGCVLAVRSGERLEACEQIYDSQGNSFSDVSSWFWNALAGRTRGPWWAVTIVTPAPTDRV